MWLYPLLSYSAVRLKQSSLGRKQLAVDGRAKLLNDGAVLVELGRNQQVVLSRRLGGQLEQPLPLVCRQGGSAVLFPGRILGLSLLLPLGDLCLFSGHLSLVVVVVALVVVEVVDRVEDGLDVLLEEGVDGDVEVGEGRLSKGRVGVLLSKLVEQQSSQVGVFDLHRQLDQHVVVRQVVLCERGGVELAGLSHAEVLLGESEGPNVETRGSGGGVALDTGGRGIGLGNHLGASHVVHENHRVGVLLLEHGQVVNDRGVVDSAQNSALVPANTVGIDIHLLEMLDHLGLVLGDSLETQTEPIVRVGVASSSILREGKGVGDTQLAINVQTKQLASHNRGGGLLAVSHDFESNRRVDTHTSRSHFGVEVWM